jgi:hypothetical protein
MGHGGFRAFPGLRVETWGTHFRTWLETVLSHPNAQNAFRMGHPFSCLGLKGTAADPSTRPPDGGLAQDDNGALGFVLSHPFREERAIDGARRISCFPRSQGRDLGHPFSYLVGDRAFPPISRRTRNGWGRVGSCLGGEWLVGFGAFPPISRRTRNGWGTEGLVLSHGGFVLSRVRRIWSRWCARCESGSCRRTARGSSSP